MNEQKKGSPRFWKTWEKAGAIGGVPEAKMRAALERGIEIDATVTTFEGGRVVRQTLSCGREYLTPGCYVPQIAIVVRGDNFRPGQVISRENLPKGAQTVERFFRKR